MMDRVLAEQTQDQLTSTTDKSPVRYGSCIFGSLNSENSISAYWSLIRTEIIKLESMFGGLMSRSDELAISHVKKLAEECEHDFRILCQDLNEFFHDILHFENDQLGETRTSGDAN